jgi:hypothetical protein
VRRFAISTKYDEDYIYLNVQDSGAGKNPEDEKNLREALSKDESGSVGECEKPLFYALLLLKRNGAQFQMSFKDGENSISIKIPCRQKEN